MPNILILFRYVYPSNRDYVPKWVMNELTARLGTSLNTQWRDRKICRGPLLDITNTYDIDIRVRGYEDARQEVWERRRELYPESKT